MLNVNGKYKKFTGKVNKVIRHTANPNAHKSQAPLPTQIVKLSLPTIEPIQQPVIVNPQPAAQIEVITPGMPQDEQIPQPVANEAEVEANTNAAVNMADDANNINAVPEQEPVAEVQTPIVSQEQASVLSEEKHVDNDFDDDWVDVEEPGAPFTALTSNIINQYFVLGNKQGGTPELKQDNDKNNDIRIGQP